MVRQVQVPPSFAVKKNAILASLSIPESTYIDLSPKGSVDAAIKPLLERINALEGVVTTSSCAGRVSTFLEGKKQGKRHEEIGHGTYNEGFGKESMQAVVPGGKGMGGRWLFVSHEPVDLSMRGEGKEAITELLGLGSSGAQNEALAVTGNVEGMRLVRFQFEPMILHIMTASLHHAQPILAAAINAGFRESGIQSLKNLDDSEAFPMIAIRTAGVALESLVGLIPDRIQDQKDGTETEEHVIRIVSEEYLELLVNIANERFKTNAERMNRFEQDLFKRESGLGQAWEDSKSRQERKRAEGLKQQQTLREAQMKKRRGDPPASNKHEELDDAGFFGSSLPP